MSIKQKDVIEFFNKMDELPEIIALSSKNNIIGVGLLKRIKPQVLDAYAKNDESAVKKILFKHNIKTLEVFEVDMSKYPPLNEVAQGLNLSVPDFVEGLDIEATTQKSMNQARRLNPKKYRISILGMASEHMGLSLEDIIGLKKDNVNLKNSNKALRKSNNDLKNENTALLEENKSLQEQVQQLKNLNIDVLKDMLTDAENKKIKNQGE